MNKEQKMQGLTGALKRIANNAQRAVKILDGEEEGNLITEFTQLMVATEEAKAGIRGVFGRAIWRVATPLLVTEESLFIWDVFCTDGHTDENYYIKAPSRSIAAEQVAMVTEYKVMRMEELTGDEKGDPLAKYQDALEKLELLAPGIPYLYDSGT